MWKQPNLVVNCHQVNIWITLFSRIQQMIKLLRNPETGGRLGLMRNSVQSCLIPGIGRSLIGKHRWFFQSMGNYGFGCNGRQADYPRGSTLPDFRLIFQIMSNLMAIPILSMTLTKASRNCCHSAQGVKHKPPYGPTKASVSTLWIMEKMMRICMGSRYSFLVWNRV